MFNTLHASRIINWQWPKFGLLCAALYCATSPSVRGSSGLRFKTWTGAYPKLTEHFQAAQLDPANNKWDKARAQTGSPPSPVWAVIGASTIPIAFALLHNLPPVSSKQRK